MLFDSKRRHGSPPRGPGDTHKSRPLGVEKAYARVYEVLRVQRRSGKCTSATRATLKELKDLMSCRDEKLDALETKRNMMRFRLDKFRCLKQLMNDIKRNGNTCKPKFSEDEASVWLRKEFGKRATVNPKRFKMPTLPQMKLRFGYGRSLGSAPPSIPNVSRCLPFLR